MQLLVTMAILQRLRGELRRGGAREIGGLLMGEHVEAEVFRIADFTVQHAGGSEACFRRDPAQHRAQLDAFFSRTGRDYSRFNYLGEWHSHPSFLPLPSHTDFHTMQNIVEDSEVGANFVILLIPRLAGRKRIELSATAFRAGAAPAAVQVVPEPVEDLAPLHACCRWLRRMFSV